MSDLEFTGQFVSDEFDHLIHVLFDAGGCSLSRLSRDDLPTLTVTNVALHRAIEHGFSSDGVSGCDPAELSVVGERLEVTRVVRADQDGSEAEPVERDREILDVD